MFHFFLIAFHSSKKVCFFLCVSFAEVNQCLDAKIMLHPFGHFLRVIDCCESAKKNRKVTTRETVKQLFDVYCSPSQFLHNFSTFSVFIFVFLLFVLTVGICVYFTAQHYIKIRFSISFKKLLLYELRGS